MGEPLMVYSIKDINAEVSKNVYLLVVDDILIGSTRKSDINEYLADGQSVLSPDDYDENCTLLLYGLVLNTQELPHELPKELEDNDIWVFQKMQGAGMLGMVAWERVSNMKEATNTIEQTIITEDMEIDDFAIVIGQEMDLIIQISPGTFKIDARYIF